MCNEEERSSEIANEFSKKVLGQAHNNKEVFKFSKNKRQLSIAELKQNLLLIIGDSEYSIVISKLILTQMT